MSNQGTLSIVFGDDFTDGIDCTTSGIEFNANPDPNDVNYYDWLTDPNASRDALQRLRYLKTRETGDQPQVPNTEGRTNGKQIQFLNFNYDNYKMRRKAEVLKHLNNKLHITKKQNYVDIVKGTRNKYKTRLKKIKADNNCPPNPNIKKKGINSGIKNDSNYIYINPNVPYYSQI